MVRKLNKSDVNYCKEEGKFDKMMNFNLFCYENMISYFGLYNMSYRLEIFIEGTRRKFSKVKENNKTLKCSLRDDCALMKDTAEVHEELNQLKADVIKLKDICYYSARRILAQVLKLPDVVVDMIFKYFVEMHKAQEVYDDDDSEWEDVDSDVEEDDNFSWNVENDVVIVNNSNHGDRYLEPYNYVNFAMDEEINLYKKLRDSKDSMYHDPLIDKDNWECLKNNTFQLEDFLNKP